MSSTLTREVPLVWLTLTHTSPDTLMFVNSTSVRLPALPPNEPAAVQSVPFTL